MPNDQLAGSPVVQHINVNVHPDVSAIARSQVFAMMPLIQDAAAGVADARRRDPKFFK